MNARQRLQNWGQVNRGSWKLHWQPTAAAEGSTPSQPLFHAHLVCIPTAPADAGGDGLQQLEFRGSGRTKKAAEEEAAAQAVRVLMEGQPYSPLQVPTAAPAPAAVTAATERKSTPARTLTDVVAKQLAFSYEALVQVCVHQSSCAWDGWLPLSLLVLTCKPVRKWLLDHLVALSKGGAGQAPEAAPQAAANSHDPVDLTLLAAQQLLAERASAADMASVGKHTAAPAPAASGTSPVVMAAPGSMNLGPGMGMAAEQQQQDGSGQAQAAQKGRKRPSDEGAGLISAASLLVGLGAVEAGQQAPEQQQGQGEGQGGGPDESRKPAKRPSPPRAHTPEWIQQQHEQESCLDALSPTTVRVSQAVALGGVGPDAAAAAAAVSNAAASLAGAKPVGGNRTQSSAPAMNQQAEQGAGAQTGAGIEAGTQAGAATDSRAGTGQGAGLGAGLFGSPAASLMHHSPPQLEISPTGLAVRLCPQPKEHADNKLEHVLEPDLTTTASGAAAAAAACPASPAQPPSVACVLLLGNSSRPVREVQLPVGCHLLAEAARVLEDEACLHAQAGMQAHASTGAAGGPPAAPLSIFEIGLQAVGGVVHPQAARVDASNGNAASRLLVLGHAGGKWFKQGSMQARAGANAGDDASGSVMASAAGSAAAGGEDTNAAAAGSRAGPAKPCTCLETHEPPLMISLLPLSVVNGSGKAAGAAAEGQSAASGIERGGRQVNALASWLLGSPVQGDVLLVGCRASSKRQELEQPQPQGQQAGQEQRKQQQDQKVKRSHEQEQQALGQGTASQPAASTAAAGSASPTAAPAATQLPARKPHRMLQMIWSNFGLTELWLACGALLPASVLSASRGVPYFGSLPHQYISERAWYGRMPKDLLSAYCDRYKLLPPGMMLFQRAPSGNSSSRTASRRGSRTGSRRGSEGGDDGQVAGLGTALGAAGAAGAVDTAAAAASPSSQGQVVPSAEATAARDAGAPAGPQDMELDMEEGGEGGDARSVAGSEANAPEERSYGWVRVSLPASGMGVEGPFEAAVQAKGPEHTNPTKVWDAAEQAAALEVICKLQAADVGAMRSAAAGPHVRATAATAGVMEGTAAAPQQLPGEEAGELEALRVENPGALPLLPTMASAFAPGLPCLRLKVAYQLYVKGPCNASSLHPARGPASVGAAAGGADADADAAGTAPAAGPTGAPSLGGCDEGAAAALWAAAGGASGAQHAQHGQHALQEHQLLLLEAPVGLRFLWGTGSVDPRLEKILLQLAAGGRALARLRMPAGGPDPLGLLPTQEALLHVQLLGANFLGVSGGAGAGPAAPSLFQPSLALQRRQLVQRLLIQHGARSLVDLGCGAGKLLVHLMGACTGSGVPPLGAPAAAAIGTGGDAPGPGGDAPAHEASGEGGESAGQGPLQLDWMVGLDITCGALQQAGKALARLLGTKAAVGAGAGARAGAGSEARSGDGAQAGAAAGEQLEAEATGSRASGEAMQVDRSNEEAEGKEAEGKEAEAKEAEANEAGAAAGADENTGAEAGSKVAVAEGSGGAGAGPRGCRVGLYLGSGFQEELRRPEAWAGLRGVDAAAMVEVVEHLDPGPLALVGPCVLGALQPRLFIVSTPNWEYNPVMRAAEAQLRAAAAAAAGDEDAEEGGEVGAGGAAAAPWPGPPGRDGLPLRCNDHRFEWTRAEFETWAQDLATSYGYDVTFTGVGDVVVQGLEVQGGDDVGKATQVAVFVQKVGQQQAGMSMQGPGEEGRSTAGEQQPRQQAGPGGGVPVGLQAVWP